MLIAQISDTHVAPPGSPFDTRWRTSAHLEAAVAHLAGLDPRPDVVVHTGDCVEGGTPEEYERLRGILDALPMPYHLVMGNHDDRDAMRRVFGDREWLPSRGFVQYVVDQGPVRLLVLDSHVPRRPEGTLCAERLGWLRERLEEEPERPTMLFVHHPPFPAQMQFFDTMGLDTSAALGEVVADFDHVERIVAGHLHRPMQHRFHGSIAQTCPSTSHQSVLDLRPSDELAFIDEPPACLLHAWSETGGLVTHTSFIRDYGPKQVVYDGERWLI